MNKGKLTLAALLIGSASLFGCASTIVAADESHQGVPAPQNNNSVQTSVSDNYVIQKNTQGESGLKSGEANDTTVKEIQISK